MPDTAKKQACDLLIEAPWVLPIAPENVALADHAVAVREGIIIAIGPSESLRQDFAPDEHVVLTQGILTPGLINAHTHAAMSLLRGSGEDLPLQSWLNERIWPLEGKLVDSEFVRTGSTLGVAEMLCSGTTTFSDMYFFPEVCAEVARSAGIRVQLAFPLFDGANAWSASIDECFSKGLALHDRYRDDPQVIVAFGPHAPYTVNRKALEKIQMLSEEINLGIHIHLHENAAEVAEARSLNGVSWVEYLADMGFLSPQLQAVHMTQLTKREIELTATNGVHVIHCPHSNLKLASGLCPTTALREAGVNLAIGTDGAACNNTLDVLQDARTASLLAKHVAGRADAGCVRDTLEMATLGGARAMGMEALIGSIEPGKQADLVAFEPTGFAAMPLLDPFASLLHSAPSYTVQHVWVSGSAVVESGAPTKIDTHALRRDVEQQTQRVRAAL